MIRREEIRRERDGLSCECRGGWTSGRRRGAAVRLSRSVTARHIENGESIAAGTIYGLGYARVRGTAISGGPTSSRPRGCWRHCASRHRRHKLYSLTKIAFDNQQESGRQQSLSAVRHSRHTRFAPAQRTTAATKSRHFYLAPPWRGFWILIWTPRPRFCSVLHNIQKKNCLNYTCLAIFLHDYVTF